MEKRKVAKLDKVRSNPFDIKVSEEDLCEEDITELIVDDDDADDVILNNRDLKQTEVAANNQISIQNDSKPSKLSQPLISVNLN